MSSYKHKSWLILLVLLSVPFVAPVIAADDDRPMIIDRSSSGGNSSRQKGNFLEILSRLNQLENEIRQLRGDLEMATHDIKQMKTRQRELYNDIDRRLRDVELRAGGGSVSRSQPSKSSSSKNSSGKTTRAAPPVYSRAESGERKEYDAAIKLLRESRYQQAIDGFRAYLSKYPKGSFAGNAQYWLAEAFYVSRDYNSALTEFQRVITDYPNNSKVVGSKLKIGYCFYEQGEFSKAKQVLKDVIRRHSRSSSAKLARIRLERMRREGK